MCAICKNYGFHKEHDLTLIGKPGDIEKENSGENVYKRVKEIFPFKYLHNVWCDSCSGPIFGDRYVCRQCSKHDLCQMCKESSIHGDEHEFELIEKEAPSDGVSNLNFDKIKEVLSFKNVKNVVCDGCSGPVFGNRYKCDECSNYDLCKSCMTRNVHNNHNLQKVK